MERNDAGYREKPADLPPKDALRQSEHNRERYYQRFDSILQQVRSMFFLLRPSGVDVQTWRWDTPVITFTWEGDDRIDRNINVLLMGETEPRAVLVEANAWQDLREGKEIFRRWAHREFQRIDVEAGFPDREVREALEEAYSEVNHWTTENLTQEELLQG